MSETTTVTLRRGLPREPDGEPWPPRESAECSADGLAAAVGASAAAATVATPEDSAQPEPAAPEHETTTEQEAAPKTEAAPEPEAAPQREITSVASPADQADGEVTLRSGLPRHPGGAPWPPEGSVAAVTGGLAAGIGALATGTAGAGGTAKVEPGADQPTLDEADTPEQPAAAREKTHTRARGGAVDVTLRQGLPRVPGGPAWPETTAVTAPAVIGVPGDITEDSADLENAPTDQAEEPTAQSTEAGKTAKAGAGTAAAAAPTAAAQGTEREQPDDSDKKPTRTEKTETKKRESAKAKPGAKKSGAKKPDADKKGKKKKPSDSSRPLLRRAEMVVVGIFALIGFATVIVGAARWFAATGAGSSLIENYPGHAPMPESAPEGIPAWLSWTHALNFFFMALIIRSGLQVRRERKPAAYWSPRWNPDRKISLSLWFHQSVDLLWLLNGLAFFILLFATGQWMRIVPTSWEVFPHAASAGLQYLTLDWPTENGWVHYNGLQQLTYFLTVFVAAPLAVLTGVRMSGLWPNRLKGLSKAYPVEAARAVHFPVMLYFCVFIVSHVALVFATGALRNLNHMYAAQGSADPAEYAGNWTGFWLFVLVLAVTAGALAAARPLVLAPVASLSGQVTNR